MTVEVLAWVEPITPCGRVKQSFVCKANTETVPGLTTVPLASRRAGFGAVTTPIVMTVAKIAIHALDRTIPLIARPLPFWPDLLTAESETSPKTRPMIGVTNEESADAQHEGGDRQPVGAGRRLRVAVAIAAGSPAR